MGAKLSVVKVGGAVLEDASSRGAFLAQFAALEGPKILVHGGGQAASALSAQLGILPNMHEGRRITDPDALDVVSMVYGGRISKSVVAELSALNCPSLGLSGADADLIRSARRAPRNGVDYGLVGDVAHVDSARILQLVALGLTPVFSALTHDGQGQLLNTNADSVAAHLAIALHGMDRLQHLLLCFDGTGVRSNPNDPNSVLESLSEHQAQTLREAHMVTDGMLAKLEEGFRAARRGALVRIGSALDLNALEHGQCGTQLLA